MSVRACLKRELSCSPWFVPAKAGSPACDDQAALRRAEPCLSASRFPQGELDFRLRGNERKEVHPSHSHIALSALMISVMVTPSRLSSTITTSPRATSRLLT